ncbi:hypothetical protein SAMN06265365_11049 [Tistlia consotensis]|uniref:Uncharacterized protein n=1 Tax=Tistlia consotensis USBA 355 TaxID=560819 RepID=A0A1Y6BT91_9PROT|nr:hypothetical protein [Tistlia consotensis]SMF27698.1 hypothetical protein SAMN05428998_109107 [Tistlia consotensis USBA 355]SNR65776.1 hypothetical protein SAMN06265365_11049 [Tistlia consotensis]
MLQVRHPVSRSLRQGDVLLLPCDELPQGVRQEPPENGRIVLARGETSGHAHAMAGDRVCYFRDDGSGQAFVRVDGDAPVALTHEEHAALPVLPGTYRVVQQREYLPRSVPRSVVD